MALRKLNRGIAPKKEIEKLKNGSPEYDKAIDDVLNLLDKITKPCYIVHTRTGLFFNGYDSSFPKGKNTLSTTTSKKFLQFGKSEDEIFELAFGDNITIREDGKKYVSNKIVYEGSEIKKILSEIYSDIRLIPLQDFSIKRE